MQDKNNKWKGWNNVYMVRVGYLAWTTVVITVVGMDELLIVRTSVTTPTGPVWRLPFWSPEIWCGQELDTSLVSQTEALHVTCSGRSEKGRGWRRQTRTLAHHFHSSPSRRLFTTGGLCLISAQNTGNFRAESIYAARSMCVYCLSDSGGKSTYGNWSVVNGPIIDRTCKFCASQVEECAWLWTAEMYAHAALTIEGQSKLYARLLLF
jgi:hypothetical protein